MQTTQSQLSRRKLLSTTVFGLPAMGALGALGLSGATPASAAQTTGADFLRTAETKTGCSYLWWHRPRCLRLLRSDPVGTQAAGG